MYSYIIYALYVILFIVLVLRLGMILLRGNKKKSINVNNYSEEVLNAGTRAMDAARNGIIKKQLLLNDSDEYNSNNALEEYVVFVEKSSVFRKIANMKESRFYE